LTLTALGEVPRADVFAVGANIAGCFLPKSNELFGLGGSVSIYLARKQCPSLIVDVIITVVTRP